jgi:isopropylmalate/homocitrate/citramalate synthase
MFERHEDAIASNTLLSAADPGIHPDLELADETLRDGEQTAGVAYSPESKVAIARELLEAGLKNLTVGFPAISEEERETIRAIARLGDNRGMFCLARAKASDLDAVEACGIGNVAMFIPISDTHLKYKLKTTPESAYEQMRESISMAVSRGMKVRFAFEDASRTPLERLRRFFGGAVEAGATMLTFADTCGVLTPFAAMRVFRELTSLVGDVPVVAHFHDDMGMATANSLGAAMGGARVVQGAINGMGERAGNTPLEELAVLFRVKYGRDLGINLERLVQAAGTISTIARVAIAPNKAVLGRNVFAHESGIHVHGLMSEASTYEPFPPEMVGRQHEVCFGKHSGLSNMRWVAQKYEITASDAVLTRALEKVKELGTRQCPPSVAETRALIEASLGERVPPTEG